MTSPCTKKLFLIVGPSGVGKTAVADRLIRSAPELPFLQKAVTRSLRPGEVSGDEVVPLDKRSFSTQVRSGAIVGKYVKYGESYGWFARTHSRTTDCGDRVITIHGIDTLSRTSALSVGDGYEAPTAVVGVVPRLVVSVCKRIVHLRMLVGRQLIIKISRH